MISNISNREKRKLCEVCGERRARTLCPRCHRLICNNCLDPVWHYCIDCASVKRVLQDDYKRYLDRVNSLLEDIKKRLSYNMCLECPILRELLFSYIKNLKDLENIARKEDYHYIMDEIKQTKGTAQRLAIIICTKLLGNLKS